MSNKITKAQEERERKAEEKRRSQIYQWVYKRLTWETAWKENQIKRKFEKKILLMISLGKNEAQICEEIKNKIASGVED